MIESVILDLDGTLIDPADGVVAAYQHTLEVLGLAVPEREQLLWVIGPPTRQNLVAMLGAAYDVDQALACFRGYYNVHGVRRVLLYRGIGEMLAQLRALPVRLYICTARPRESAEQTLQYLGIDRYIDGVYGAEADGRFEDKADLLALLLAREQVMARSALMVGDRASDIVAASQNAIRAIAVGWGYGSRDELAGCGALDVCDAPDTLVGAIRRLMGHHGRSLSA